MKHRISIILSLMILLSVIIPTAVFAETSPAEENQTTFELSEKEMTISDYGTEFYLWPIDSNIVLNSVTSSKSSVATAIIAYNSVAVLPKKPGKTTLTVTDSNGLAATVNVVVKKSWITNNLKNSSCYIYYESKRAEVFSLPKAKVIVKIGGKTYKKKTSDDGSATIKLKKRYKYGTKYTVKYSYKGHSRKFSKKVDSKAYASFGTIWTCKSYVPVTAYNVVKGDIICLTVNGKTYRQNVGYTADRYGTTFWTDSNLGYTYSLKVSIKDKRKKTRYSYTWYPRW